MPPERPDASGGWSRSVDPVLQAKVLAVHQDGPILSASQAPANASLACDTALAWVNTMPEDSRHAVIKHSQQVDRQYQMLHASPQLISAWGSAVRVGVVPRPAPGGAYHMLQPTVDVIKEPTCWSCQPKLTDQEWNSFLRAERIRQLAAAGHVLPDPACGALMQPRAPPMHREQSPYESSADVQVPGATALALPAPPTLQLPTLIRAHANQPDSDSAVPSRVASPPTADRSTDPDQPLERQAPSTLVPHTPQSPPPPLIQDEYMFSASPPQPPTQLPGLVHSPEPSPLQPHLPMPPPWLDPHATPGAMQPPEFHSAQPLSPSSPSPGIRELPSQQVYTQPAQPPPHAQLAPPGPRPQQEAKSRWFGSLLSCCRPRALPEQANTPQDGSNTAPDLQPGPHASVPEHSLGAFNPQLQSHQVAVPSPTPLPPQEAPAQPAYPVQGLGAGASVAGSASPGMQQLPVASPNHPPPVSTDTTMSSIPPLAGSVLASASPALDPSSAPLTHTGASQPTMTTQSTPTGLSNTPASQSIHAAQSHPPAAAQPGAGLSQQPGHSHPGTDPRTPPAPQAPATPAITPTAATAAVPGNSRSGAAVPTNSPPAALAPPAAFQPASQVQPGVFQATPLAPQAGLTEPALPDTPSVHKNLQPVLAPLGGTPAAPAAPLASTATPAQSDAVSAGKSLPPVLAPLGGSPGSVASLMPVAPLGALAVGAAQGSTATPTLAGRSLALPQMGLAAMGGAATDATSSQPVLPLGATGPAPVSPAAHTVPLPSADGVIDMTALQPVAPAPLPAGAPPSAAISAARTNAW